VIAKLLVVLVDCVTEICAEYSMSQWSDGNMTNCSVNRIAPQAAE